VTVALEAVARVNSRSHVYAVDLVRVLTFACVIAVHTVATVNSADSVPAGGAAMLLHFTREAFFSLTAFVLVHRYRDRLHIRPFWRRRFLLVGVPYVIWSVIYSGLALITTPVPPTAALIQLARNLLTGTAWYHLYFLVVTMQFYLLFPLFLRLLRASAGRRGGHFALLGAGLGPRASGGGAPGTAAHRRRGRGLVPQVGTRWHPRGAGVGCVPAGDGALVRGCHHSVVRARHGVGRTSGNRSGFPGRRDQL
jgi:peptidoglycan/LPS O-acetylase OafA/YrhL